MKGGGWRVAESDEKEEGGKEGGEGGWSDA